MKYYELRNSKSYVRDCPDPDFKDHYDLIVVGLGSAGTYCALAAAEEGCKVLGIDRGTCAGGMSVRGVVNGYYNGYPGGSFESVDEAVEAKTHKIYRWFRNHPDGKKIEVERRLISAGVDMRLQSTVIGLFAENNQVRGIRLFSAGQPYNVSCRFLSDSTSEGYLLHILGIDSQFGRNTDHSTQPFSSVRVFLDHEGNMARTNDDSGYINQYDDFEFSHDVIRAHAKHNEYCDPKKERFLYVSPQIGVRGGVRFEGEEQITMQKIIDLTDYPQVLCCAYSDIDRHGLDRAFDEKIYQDWYVISNLSTVTMKIRIPMGAVIPRGWKGIYSVSRCLSVDDYASSTVRMNRDMYRLGEAVGVAISMAVKSNLEDIRQIDKDAFLTNVEGRACFDPRPDQVRGFVDQRTLQPFTPVSWLTDLDEIAEQLDTDTPGVAIWSCNLLGKEAAADYLYNLSQNSNSKKQSYAATIALGLLEDERSIPKLREIVRNRSAYHFEDCRRTNQLRSVIAICLIGRFGDSEILPDLIEILQPAEYDKPMYHVYIEPSYKFNIVKEINSVYYQHFSFALVSIAQILEANPDLKPDVVDKLKHVFDEAVYVDRMTSGLPGSTYDIIVKNLKRYADRSILDQSARHAASMPTP